MSKTSQYLWTKLLWMKKTQANSTGQKRLESFPIVRGSVGVADDMCLITHDHADMIWSRLTGHPSGKRIRADTRAGDTTSPAGRERSHRRVETVWHAAWLDDTEVCFCR